MGKIILELYPENPFDLKIIKLYLEKEDQGVNQKKLDVSSKESFVCDDCGKKIAKVVVDFCKKHPEWFDGVFCRDCQSKHIKKEDE